MLKIKEHLQNFIEIQNQINESLKGLREDLKPKLDTITTTYDKLDLCDGRINTLADRIESNIYTKEQTLETINKEYDYRKEHERCSKENAEYENDYLHISFEKQDKEVIKTYGDDNSPEAITMRELQAINKQVEELHWND